MRDVKDFFSVSVDGSPHLDVVVNSAFPKPVLGCKHQLLIS